MHRFTRSPRNATRTISPRGVASPSLEEAEAAAPSSCIVDEIKWSSEPKPLLSPPESPRRPQLDIALSIDSLPETATLGDKTVDAFREKPREYLKIFRGAAARAENPSRRT